MTATATTTGYVILPSNDMDTNAAIDSSPTTVPASAASSSRSPTNESTLMTDTNNVSSTAFGAVATISSIPPVARSSTPNTASQIPPSMRLLSAINFVILVHGLFFISVGPIQNILVMGYYELGFIGIFFVFAILAYTAIGVEQKDTQTRLFLWIVFLLFIWYPLDPARIPCSFNPTEDNPTPCLGKGVSSGIFGYFYPFIIFHATTMLRRGHSFDGTGAYGELHKAAFAGLLGVFTWIPRRPNTCSTVAPTVGAVAADPVTVKDLSPLPPPSYQGEGSSSSSRRLDASDMV